LPETLTPENPDTVCSVPVAPLPQPVPFRPETLSPADRTIRRVNLAAVLVPLIGLGVAIYFAWGTAFDWTQAAISLSMSTLTALGITVGFHRLFTHKSFTAVAPVRYALAALGSMAVQGPVIEWAGAHRKHHQHSDGEEDPHSPHHHTGGAFGATLIGTLKGFWHAHMGWMLKGHQRGLARYTKDLREDPVIAAANRHFKFWVLMGLLIPALAGGLITMTFEGALLGFLWGGLVRILVNHHITWSVNSICHLWGTSPFVSHDESRNNALVGVLAMGEGWHNNHHAFPTSARHGLRWWELDVSYMVIRALVLLRLAGHVKLPTEEKLASRRK
jgi:stearoyl-CoA desaturase (Delta-9 desaturase)